MASETQDTTASKPASDLNDLLEDALDDLLLQDDDDDYQDVVADRAEMKASKVATIEEKAGKPDIQESLKKITEKEDATSGKKKSPKASGSSTKSKAKDSSAKVGSSSSSGGGGDPSSVVDIDEMNRFFANMTEQLKAELPPIDPNEAQARLNESVPQIFEMMQTLLSKELLYKALTELLPKFEVWLEKNMDTLSKEDKRRYKKQMSKIQEIIAVFDDESLGDQARFERNLELMEQMQSLGAPPEELTVPDGMTKCSIM